SIQSLFPDIEEAVLLAIGRHTFRPGHIFKLDTRIREKVSTVTLDFENGCLVQRDKDPSPKDYPNWGSLYYPLLCYFSILQSLYTMYMEYEWTAVLNYHFATHAKHLAEMTYGDYSRWGEIDGNLLNCHLIGHPRARLYKDKPSAPKVASDISKQTCNDFNYRQCTRLKCACMHKCRTCDSTEHGHSSCPSKKSS
ncbi:hypothetical protein K439DRAFT_1325900, partial [Ramaria rubella]